MGVKRPMDHNTVSNSFQSTLVILITSLNNLMADWPLFSALKLPLAPIVGPV